MKLWRERNSMMKLKKNNTRGGDSQERKDI